MLAGIAATRAVTARGHAEGALVMGLTPRSRRIAALSALLVHIALSACRGDDPPPPPLATADSSTATRATTEPTDTPTPTTVPPDESQPSGEEATRANSCHQRGADCQALLAIKDPLAGTATLNWSASVATEDWDGVTVSEGRVTALELPGKSLTGTLAAGLGSLAKLRELDLRNNSLTGAVPLELAALTELRVLKLSGNMLTGCVPASMRATLVTNLGYPFCPAVGRLQAKSPVTSVAYGEAINLTVDVFDPSGAELESLPEFIVLSWTLNGSPITGTVSVSHTPTAEEVGETLTFTATVDRTSCPTSCTTTFAVKVNPPPAPDLVVISEGAADALLLEWTGGPPNATKWQYRTRAWSDGAPNFWGSWTDVPESDSSTTTYRLTGLAASTGYQIELRGLVGDVASVSSGIADAQSEYPPPMTVGITRAANELPMIYRHHPAEGDGTTKWRVFGLNFSVVIPDGMRLRIVGAAFVQGGMGNVGLLDITSNTAILLDPYTGEEVFRESQSGSPQTSDGSPTRDVNALFDQIVASVEEIE